MHFLAKPVVAAACVFAPFKGENLQGSQKLLLKYCKNLAEKIN